ncbi:MAG: diguanylate cyclase, partial [Treponema sp.]|nr:diguanylate cyclase [Treponema sp.]
AKTLKSILAECYSNGEDNVDITPSIGISLFPEQGTTFRSLFQKADTALYHVKENGKNNFAIYNNDMKNVGESVYVQN